MNSSKQELVDRLEVDSVVVDFLASKDFMINSDREEGVQVVLEVATLLEIYLKNLKSSLEVEEGHRVVREGLVEDNSKLKVKISWYASILR